MTYDDRVHISTLITLLAVVLAVTAAWQHGMDAEALGWTAAAVYATSVLALAPAMQAPSGAVATASIKYTVATFVFTMLAAAVGAHAVAQLLRGRQARRAAVPSEVVA
ncbi:hypothetical protein [Streptomyces acidiscabies]|uniref:hypothetical protein n=1 Tax=Streptomyces acidiscabies TaxID=42234 RepID=UPI0038F6E070